VVAKYVNTNSYDNAMYLPLDIYIYMFGAVPGFTGIAGPYRYGLDLAMAQAVTGLKLVNATATGI